MVSTLIITSNLGLEVGLGYLAQKLVANVDVRILTCEELWSPQPNLEKYHQVIVCGDGSAEDGAQLVGFEPGTSPTSTLFNILGVNPDPNLFPLLSLLDEHMTQPFRMPIIEHFAIGLANHASKSTHEMLKHVIDHPEELKNILRIGEVLFESQVRMVRNRVERNSRYYQISQFPDVKCVICSASERIVLTHAMLHEKYPDAQVSAVVNIEFGAKVDRLKFSLYSYDGTDLQRIACHFAGRGTKVSAAWGSRAMGSGTLIYENATIVSMRRS